MTLQEFNETRFGAGMRCIYKGKEFDICQIDFEESLIGIDMEISGADEGEITWVRCENIKLINY